MIAVSSSLSNCLGQNGHTRRTKARQNLSFRETEVAKQHDEFARANAFGVLVSAHACV